MISAIGLTLLGAFFLGTLISGIVIVSIGNAIVPDTAGGEL